jgi:pimeloyl-ACP methyl ester carboxylesterase
MIEPESRYFESSRLRLHYVVWGDESRPALLLVHGGQDHARSWDFVAERMVDRYAVYGVDLRGHGDSDWAKGPAYQFSNHVSDIAKLVDILDRDKIRIVGHSMGGRVVVDYACTFPERVDRIVSIEGFGRPPVDLTPAQRVRKFVDDIRKSEAFRPHVYPTIEAAEKRMQEANEHLTPEMVRHLTRYAVRPGEDGGWVWKYDPFQRVLPTPDWSMDEFRQMWKALQAPILMLGGTESWFSRERMGIVESALPHARTVMVEGAGHWVHHDQLETFVKLVRDFFE